MRTAIAKYKLKIESPQNIILHKLNKIFWGREKAEKLKCLRLWNQLRKKYFKNGIWNFNGILLPDYFEDNIGRLMHHIYLDSLFVYCIHDDNYDSSLVDRLDLYLPEGPYGYKNEKIDVTINKDDIVIDVGAWIGDFSGYASIKGAKVYAFEPSKYIFEYLKITQRLNPNIEIINKALGEIEKFGFLSINSSNSGNNKIGEENESSERIEITTLDKFVFENNINKIDFIKADIEGFERNMFSGAKDTLKRFAPKLAICTYHLPDDPEVLAKIILEANPDYQIVQKKNKLYASV